MIKTGIIGGAGYTAGELIRLLLSHPRVDLTSVVSVREFENPLYSVHFDLLGETEIKFTKKLDEDVDVVFLCLHPGTSREAIKNIADRSNVIDLSNDFRLIEHSAFGMRSFIYGLPEQQRSIIRKAISVANPGCFATAIQIAILPLAYAQCLKSDIHISAITGSTGAGKALNEKIHFSWRNNNISSYNIFIHHHLNEIREVIHRYQKSFQKEIFLVPYRGNFSRGIISTVYTDSLYSLDENKDLYQSYYKKHPFVSLSERELDLKQVIGTNKCFLHLSLKNGKIIITSIIDNLLKGSSGQAVQNMNIMQGWEEDCGLKLKPSLF
ncbi:MAG TPA: N-acetyl-gamma-glutamyl-phosphate reductase [Blattabacteriaceae bacterium]